MPTSEAAIKGISQNGLRWKYKVGGVKAAITLATQGVEELNAEKVEAAMRTIYNNFEKFFENYDDFTEKYVDSPSMGDRDALDFFKDETPVYEFENGQSDEFFENLKYYLDQLYDIADYERILIS